MQTPPDGPTDQTHSTPAAAPSNPTPRRPSSPETTPLNTPEILAATRTQTPSGPETMPSNIPRISAVSRVRIYSTPTSPSLTPQRSSSLETTPRNTPEIRAATEIHMPMITALTPAPATDESTAPSTSPSRSASPIPMQKPTGVLGVSPSHCSLRARPSASGGERWTPTHTPSWSLGPQHARHVHAALAYLLGVPGGPKWEKLLASFITFEGLSSARPVSISFANRPVFFTNSVTGLV